MTSPQASFWSYHSSGWLVALEHVSPMATWPSKIRLHGPGGKEPSEVESGRTRITVRETESASL